MYTRILNNNQSEVLELLSTRFIFIPTSESIYIYILAEPTSYTYVSNYELNSLPVIILTVIFIHIDRKWLKYTLYSIKFIIILTLTRGIQKYSDSLKQWYYEYYNNLRTLLI